MTIISKSHLKGNKMLLDIKWKYQIDKILLISISNIDSKKYTTQLQPLSHYQNSSLKTWNWLNW